MSCCEAHLCLAGMPGLERGRGLPRGSMTHLQLNHTKFLKPNKCLQTFPLPNHLPSCQPPSFPAQLMCEAGKPGWICINSDLSEPQFPFQKRAGKHSSLGCDIQDLLCCLPLVLLGPSNCKRKLASSQLPAVSVVLTWSLPCNRQGGWVVPGEPSPYSRPSLYLEAVWALSSLSQGSHERLGPMFIEHLLQAVPKGSIVIFILLNYGSSGD